MEQVYNYLSKRLFRSLRFYFFIVFTLIAGVRIAWSYRNLNAGLSVYSWEIYGLLTNTIFVLFVYSLMFLLSLEWVTDFFFRYKIILSYRETSAWWQAQTKAICYYACIYALSINMIIVFTIIMSGHVGGITIQFLLCLGWAGIIQVIGYAIMGTIYSILLLLLNNKHISLALVFGFLVVSWVIVQAADLNVATITDYMFLAEKLNQETYRLDGNDSLIAAGFIGVFSLLYLFGGRIIRQKDIYWSE